MCECVCGFYVFAEDRNILRLFQVGWRKGNQQKEINEQTTTTIDKSKWVINVSTDNITEDERELLENGMNYSITPASQTIDLVAKLETTLTEMTTEEADTIRADLSSIIRKAKPPKRNITRKQSTSLKSL